MWLKVDSRLINLDHVSAINSIDCAPKNRDLKTLYIQQGNMHENLAAGKAKDIEHLQNCIAQALRMKDVNLLDVDKLLNLIATKSANEQEPQPEPFGGAFRDTMKLFNKMSECLSDAEDWEGEDDE